MSDRMYVSQKFKRILSRFFLALPIIGTDYLRSFVWEFKIPPVSPVPRTAVLYWEVRLHMSTNYNPVVKVEGRRPDTLTTGLFLLSIPGMAT